MCGIFYSLVVLMQVTALLSASPPQKCKVSDSGCLKTAAQAMALTFADGILGTEPLDAMLIDNIKVELAGLRFNMTNVNITGLKDVVIDKIKIDMDKKQLVVVYHANVKVNSHYTAAGRLLILPINGDGVFKMQLINAATKMTIPFTIVKNEEGKDTMQMKEHKWDFEVKDRARYDATNLFNGNKVLSDPMLKFMNDNWREICHEFAPAVMTKPNVKIFNAIRKYMQSMPLNEIVDV